MTWPERTIPVVSELPVTTLHLPAFMADPNDDETHFPLKYYRETCSQRMGLT